MFNETSFSLDNETSEQALDENEGNFSMDLNSSQHDQHQHHNMVTCLRDKLSEMNHQLTHEKIMLLAIGEYIKRDFVPSSFIYNLFEMTRKIARNSRELLCDFNVPFILDEREKLLNYFYQQAYETAFPSTRERKILFTLTLLQMLKNLGDFIFTQSHPRKNRNELRLSFIIPHLFFAIPYYKFIFDWFSFEEDSIQIQLLFVKFMEIKIANETNAAWAKFVKPMTLKHASILFGSKNPFRKKTVSSPLVKCTVNITSSFSMIEAIEEFMRGGEMQWENVGEKFMAKFELSCPRNRVENCRSSFFMNINHDETNPNSSHDKQQ